MWKKSDKNVDDEDAELDSLSLSDAGNDGGKNYLHTLACAKFGRVSACGIFLVLACLASGLSAVLVTSRSGKSSSAAWTSMRWTNKGPCLPAYRLADAPIYCLNGRGPLNASSDGKQVCGGVSMKRNFCTLPTAGSWVKPPEASTPPPLPRRFGIGMQNSAKPLCTTMKDLITGNFRGDESDQEWVPKTCRAVPLSPFVWTENTKCQVTIAMIVSKTICHN
jgi:hypothetical protein